MRRCKDCRRWQRTDERLNIPNPSGKCNGRYNNEYEGYGTHADEEACYDFKSKTSRKFWKFWRPKQNAKRRV